MSNFIETLPFPRKPFTWFAAIIILVITYTYYYNIAYPILKEVYSSQFKINAIPYSIEKNGKNYEYEIVVRVPFYKSDYEMQWIYIEVENKTEVFEEESGELESNKNYEIINGDPVSDPEKISKSIPITIYLNSVTQESNLSKQLLLEAFKEEDYLKNCVEFDRVIPGMRSYAKIPYLYDEESSTTLEEISVNINGNQEDVISFSSIDDSWKILTFSLINQVLLPPWSNGIILLFNLLLCYFLEESNVWRNPLDGRHFLSEQRIMNIFPQKRMNYKLTIKRINELNYWNKKSVRIKIIRLLRRVLIIICCAILINFALSGIMALILCQWHVINVWSIFGYILCLPLFWAIFIKDIFGSIKDDFPNQRSSINLRIGEEVEVYGKSWEFKTIGKNYILTYNPTEDKGEGSR